MGILRSLGGVANSWAKFVVALGALGWFGVYALDELRTPKPIQHLTNSIAKYDEGLPLQPESDTVTGNNVTVENEPNDEAPSNSVFKSLAVEAWSAGSSLMGNPVAQLALIGLLGGGVGLALRPTLTRINRHRRLLAAKRRQSLLEEDRQLLAADGLLSSTGIQSSQAESPISGEVVLPAAKL